MKITELQIEINKCHFLWEIISLSRSWYWTCAENELRELGESLIIKKAQSLNKLYACVESVLVLKTYGEIPS